MTKKKSPASRKGPRRRPVKGRGGKGNAGRALGLLGLSSGVVLAALYAVGKQERVGRAMPEPGHGPGLPSQPATTGDPEDAPEERTLATERGELAFEIAGRGAPPIVFLHGLGGDRSFWRPAIRRLAPDHRCLALDWPGHGASPLPRDGGWRIEELAEDLSALLAAETTAPAILVGHDAGAAVAIKAAVRAPERVAGVVLVDPSGDQTRLPARDVEAFLDALDPDPVRELRWNFDHMLSGAPEEARRAVRDALERARPEALLAFATATARHSPVASLETYEGPVLSLASPLNSLPISLHRLVPSLPVQPLDGVGHWPMLEQPDLFADLLRGFLDRAKRRARLLPSQEPSDDPS